MNVTEDIARMYARLDDLCRAADRGEVGQSDFLTPRELHYAQVYLNKRGAGFLSFGGYADAERRKIYVLPDYMEGASDIAELEDYGHDSSVGAVRVSTAGYRRLSHRDYLGSILGLGLERSVMGDILVFGDDGAAAVIFCNKALVPFLTEELVWVAREKVRCVAVDLSDIEMPERRFAAINDTVASPRADCIVGALCSLSRERAREAVVSGLVEVDFEPEERPDRALSAPCLVSVRGYGRFRVISVEDKTKKGRYRLVAEKFL